MITRYLQWPHRVAATLALVVLTAQARWAASAWLGNELFYGVFMVPLLLSAMLFGHQAAVLATVTGFAFGTAFASQSPNPWQEVGAGVLFLSVGAMVSAGIWKLGAVMAQLRLADEKARQAHHHKDRFLAVLGHELRNPLNGIVLGSGLLLRQAESDPNRQSVARMIERQARHMQKLIDEMLDISRIEQGKIQLDLKEVVLQDIIKTCLHQQTERMHNRKQGLLIDMPREPVVVRGDPDRLIQVVANLLTNASKYSGPCSRIDVRLKRAADQALLEVRDDGPGIPADKLALIFEPFMQMDNATDRGDGGLGLGLPTAKGLVELHGGSIEASSPGPLGGAVFSVRLPLHQR